MSPERFHRALVVIAALVCLLFVGTLSDYSPYFLVVQTLKAPPVPSSFGEREGKLIARVVEPGGAPVQNARVTVLLIRDGLAYLAGFRITGNDGVASFDDLPPGVSWLLADAEGKGRASSQIVVGPDPRDVSLVMSPAFSLQVEVTSDDDDPLVDAQVLVSCSDPLPFVGKTDEQGFVELERLCPPPYTLEVSADGYESSTRGNVLQGPKPVRVSLRKLGWIDVSVVDQQGEPAPLSTVFVAGPSIWPARQTESNAFGRSKIGGLPAGNYDLRATRGNLASPITTGVAVERGKGTPVKLILGPGRNILVTVVGGTTPEAAAVPNASVVLVEDGLSSFPLQGRTGGDGTVRLGPLPPGPLTASARAEGYVSPGAIAVGPEDVDVRIALLKAGTLTGEVVDNHGFPVPGCSIEVIGTDLSGLPIAETPASLAFRRAHFAWAMHGPPTLIPAGELGVMPGPIPPIPRGEFSGGSLRLPPIPSDKTGPAGASDAPTPWVTDGDGRFSVGPIPPGRISAIVRHPAHVEAISEAVTLAPGGTAHVRVVLYAGGTLEGVVLDDRRFPISGAYVRITAKEGSSERMTLTATDGTFAFSAVPATLLVTASRPESPEKVAYQETIPVAADERKEIEIVLVRERPAIVLHVTDDRGYPVDRAHIRAISLTTDVSLRRTTFSNEKGEATVEDAAGIRLRLEVSANGYGTVVKTYDASPEDIKIQLERGLRLQGEVTGRGGRERVTGARVTLYLPTGARDVTTGDDGVFRADDISPGPLRLRVEHDDYVGVEKTVEVKAPSDVERPVRLDRIDLVLAGAVEGEVVDDRGNPVAGAKVSKDEVPEYLPTGPLPPGVVATNELGEFRLGGLPEGDLTLEAYAPGVGRGKEEKIAVRKERTTARVRIRLEVGEGKAGPAVVAGVAVTVASGGSGVLVTGVIAGSEADRAGMQAGDLILRIDGVAPEDERDAVQRMRGPERQEVLLELQRGQKTLELRVARERIRQ